MGRSLPEHQLEQIKKLRLNGLTYAQIAESLSVTEALVKKWAKIIGAQISEDAKRPANSRG